MSVKKTATKKPSAKKAVAKSKDSAKKKARGPIPPAKDPVGDTDKSKD
ncbi:MAG: hypothetical protein P9M14_16490 [Candidatus Alcyoniella australis]|nr:hypothetical protein [Candidatus Alcyoniella australis]